jgi:hypothetical protein
MMEKEKELLSVQEKALHKKEKYELVAIIQSQNADIATLKDCVISITDVLGLYDSKAGSLKKEVKEGNYLKPIIKSLGEVMGMLTMSKMGFGDDKALLKKFEFIKNVLPLIEKYANK